ncbi:MAG: flagellin FliC [Deltaproteobacteria bacterium]|nr:flagellin FliC [Deltaproteobacteria bacterium]
MRIVTNLSSLEAQKNLGRTNAKLQSSFNKLSSGLRINTAADDAAGLAISERMKTQIRSYVVAERNANDAISMVQTAEGALGEVHGILGRMRELAIQSANGSMTSTDRGYLDTEFKQLQAEITRIQGAAKFNGKQLLATAATSITFQIGLDNASFDQLAITFGGFALTTLLATATNLAGATASASLASLTTIDNALQTISTERAKYGASMNRLEITTNAIQTMRVNLSASNSRIRDVDVAEETSRLAANQVIAQAGVSVLAQANQLPQMAMQLLQG